MTQMGKSSLYTMASQQPSYYSTGTRDTSLRENEDMVGILLTIPPDGGWGWVVVAASFMGNFIADGVIFTFGIFLDEISESFKASPTKIAIANSLMTGFYYASGPVVCSLVNRYGFRLIGFLGGLIATVAFLTSSRTYSVVPFLVLYGVVGGLGFGMVYAASVIVIGFYFERWRALATSIAVSGSSMGIICFPIITKDLLGTFHWRTKFQVLMVGCILCSLCALLYRPLKPDQTVMEDKRMQFLDDTNSIGSFHMEKSGFLKKVYNKFHNKVYPTVYEVTDSSTMVITIPKKANSSSSTFLASIPETSFSSLMKSVTSRIETRSEKLSVVYEEPRRPGKCAKWCKKCWSRCRTCCRSAFVPNRPMYRDDIFYASSLYTLPEYSRSVANAGPSVKASVDYHMSVTRIATHRDVEEHYHFYKCCPEAIKRTLATMMDFNLLKSPSFILLAVSGFLTVLGVYSPFIYLVQRAHQKGIEENAAYYMLSALGISNGLGRIISGIISSFPNVKCLMITYVSLFICGVSTIISVFLDDVYSQFCYVGIFGLSLACLASLRAPIVVEMLGLKQLTNAFGLLMLFQGAASFIGVPIAGVIVEWTDSYESCFVFAGSTITLSAVLLVPIKRISKWEKKTKKKKSRRTVR